MEDLTIKTWKSNFVDYDKMNTATEEEIKQFDEEMKFYADWVEKTELKLKAHQEARNLGFLLGNIICHKNQHNFKGEIVDFLYNYEGTLFVKISYNNGCEDTFDLSNWLRIS